MPSPITTSGFEARVMPQYPSIDPRLLAPQLSQILPAAAQGFEFGASINRTRSEEAMRPLRQRIAELQLEEALAMQGIAPLKAQRERILLGQPIERVTGAGVEVVPRYPEITSIGDNGQTITERPAGEDVFATEQIQVIDPATGAVSTQTRRTKPITTMEEAARQADLADYRGQLADASTARAEALRIAAEAKAQNDKLRADAAMLRAQALQNNPAVGFVDVKRADGRTYRQYFPKGQPQQIVHEIDRGELGNDLFNFGTVNMGQPGATKPLSAPVAAPAAGFEAEVQGLLGGELPAVTAPAAQSYPSADAVRAAFRAGTIPRAEAERILQQQFGYGK